MNYARACVTAVCICLLAGCASPKKKTPGTKESVPPAAGTTDTLKQPDTGTTRQTGRTPGSGKATSAEIAKATKGESIPQIKIPAERKFISPDKISEKVAAIFKNILFNFDKYDLTPDAQAVLKEVGAYLTANPNVHVIIEGHCDERGTREYNLVLGEQRSLSARRYLVALGVSPDRLFTVSYGKDRPLDARACEEAWAKNRRCEFKLSVE